MALATHEPAYLEENLAVSNATDRRQGVELAGLSVGGAARGLPVGAELGGTGGARPAGPALPAGSAGSAGSAVPPTQPPGAVGRRRFSDNICAPNLWPRACKRRWIGSLPPSRRRWKATTSLSWRR